MGRCKMASGQPPPRVWNPNQMYDVSQDEQRLIQARAKRRAQLKAEWQQKVSNPYRGVTGHIFDPGFQRFIAMKATAWDQFKATPRSGFFAFCMGVLPIGFFTWKVRSEKIEKERILRSGQVSYRDRAWKWI